MASFVFCAVCGKSSDRGMIQLCRSCSGWPACDECGNLVPEIVVVRLRCTATAYRMTELCGSCLTKNHSEIL